MPLDQVWWYGACGRFQKEIGHTFSSPELLEEALTHASYANENGLFFDNERLEFLGDAVLELGISEILFKEHPGWNEGELTRERARIVCESSLAERAKNFGLPQLLRLGRGLERQGGRENPSLCADALEACIGALHLDGGMEAAQELIRKIYEDFLEREPEEKVDAKSALQMRLQVLRGESPTYSLFAQQGPSHCPKFHVKVFSEPSSPPLAEGWGSSRKEAENEAAKKALARLTSEKRTSNDAGEGNTV
jgi:ribonuclease-3